MFFLVGLQLQDLFVLCKVLKKNKVGPRSSEDHGPRQTVKKVLEGGSDTTLVIGAPPLNPPPANTVSTVKTTLKHFVVTSFDEHPSDEPTLPAIPMVCSLGIPCQHAILKLLFTCLI